MNLSGLLAVAQELGHVKIPVIHAHSMETAKLLFEPSPPLRGWEIFPRPDLLLGMDVVVDPTVAPNTVQLRSQDGEVLRTMVQTDGQWYILRPLDFPVEWPIDDLTERLSRAAERLKALFHEAERQENASEADRLGGKIEGVYLAQDYLRGYRP